MGKPGSRSESSTKADRKFEKKLEFYAKVRDAVSSLGAQKAIFKKKKLRSRQKKLKAYDLSSFSEFLPELKEKRPTPALEFKINCKSKKKLVKVFQFFDSKSGCNLYFSFSHSPTEFQLSDSGCHFIRLKEGKQLTTVLNHPTFKSNPLAAIHQHLQSTQPVVDVKPEKRKNKSGSKKRKEKKSKASVGPQAMDM